MLKEQRESVEQLRDSVCSRSNVTSRINDLQADVANLEKLMLSGFQDTAGHFQKDKSIKIFVSLELLIYQWKIIIILCEEIVEFC